jgi:hypothetical protein
MALTIVGPDSRLGLCADFDLAACSAASRPHHRGARAGTPGRSHRCRLRLPDRGQDRYPRAGHFDFGGGRTRHPAFAAGAGRVRRQLRGRLRHHQPRQTTPALLRDVPAGILGHYVGALSLVPLKFAIHKMTGAVARALKTRRPWPAEGRVSRRRDDL